MSANGQDENAPKQQQWNADTPGGGGQGGPGRARSGGQRGSRGGGKFSGGDRGGRNAGAGGGARSRAGLLNIDCANVPSSYENPWGYSQGSGNQQQGYGSSADVGQDWYGYGNMYSNYAGMQMPYSPGQEQQMGPSYQEQYQQAMLNQMQMQEMMKQQYMMGQMAYSPTYQAAAAGSSPSMQGPGTFYPMSPMAYPTHSPYFGGGQDGKLAAPNPNMGAYQQNQQQQQQYQQQQHYQQQQYQQQHQQYQQQNKKWKQRHVSHTQWGEEPSMGQQGGMHHTERYQGREGQQKHPTEMVEGMSDEDVNKCSSTLLTRTIVELLREGEEGKTRAWHFFERLCQHSKADVYQYSVMLNACIDSHSADKLIERMQRSEIEPSEVTYQKLYKIYLRDARVVEAAEVLEKMNVLMEADGNLRLPDDYTNRVLTDMLLEMVKDGADSQTKACTLFNKLREEGKVNVIHYNVMLNMCKSTSEALAFMSEAKESGIEPSERSCMKIAKMFARDCDQVLSANVLEAIMRSLRTTTLFGGTVATDALPDMIEREVEKMASSHSPARGAGKGSEGRTPGRRGGRTSSSGSYAGNGGGGTNGASASAGGGGGVGDYTGDCGSSASTVEEVTSRLEETTVHDVLQEVVDTCNQLLLAETTGSPNHD